MTIGEGIETFDNAAGAVVKFIPRRYGLGAWMITREQRERWVVLYTADAGRGVGCR